MNDVNRNVANVNDSRLRKVLNTYGRVFEQDNSGIKELRAIIRVKPDAKPVYQKARPVPYSLLSEVEQEYDRLVQAGILHQVNHSKWATPVVNVVKTNGKIRTCGDYKLVNEQIEDDHYNYPMYRICLPSLPRAHILRYLVS